MRVLLDTRDLSLPQGTGIATYARNLSLAIADLGHSVDLLYEFNRQFRHEPALEEISFYDPQYGSGYSVLDRVVSAAKVAGQIVWPQRPARAYPIVRSGFVDNRAIRHRMPHFDRILTSPLIYRKAWNYFSITGRFMPVVADVMPDIAHWTAPFPIVVPGARNVYTIHDVVPLKLPFTSQDNRRKYAQLIRTIVRDADQIVTVSETTTADLVRLQPAAAAKITNTFQSVNIPPDLMEVSQKQNGEMLENIFGVENQKYFVFYSAIEPKKNIGRLVEAYLASGSSYPLLIVGRKGWLYEGELKPLAYPDIKAQLRGDLDASGGRVVSVDYVSFSLLIALVRSARAVLFPSIYEGFGLPILEAMTCGTPVMTSNYGAMKEIAGAEAGLLVDPLNVAEMAAAIRRLTSDDDLCRKLSAAGLERSKAFSAEKYRARLVDAYDAARGKELRKRDAVPPR